MKTNTKQLVQLALLTAVILVMAFTPIGYLKTLGLEITLIVVPVAIGAVLLGPKGGAVLGTVFGVTSFIQCFGMSPFGAALLSISPVGTFITCIIPRILAGWLSGVVYAVLKRGKAEKASVWIANLSCPLLNTVLFMSSLVLFFYNTEYIQGFAATLGAANPFAFIILFVGVNGLIEAATCFVLGSAVSKALIHLKK
ncbi:ECF transporter S component [Acetivibrio sp. MSJd-27]|uniref:ECF transporter S component n=1 Tax=Acetivibrio sp. MSJd-27 TaxID=2841523 RepID=UPI001C129664|nr:ECF transporter S component [Acetivibrio sp. MSJd-27]MBU5450454.1 ECF transporter S component [Acetivibrio sp. MSJd-27]